MQPSASVRSAITLLALAGFFSGCALRICDGLLPRIASEFAVSAGTAGRVVLTFSIAYGISQLVFGPLGDRFGKARMVCVAMFGCTLGALVCTLAASFQQLVVLRAVWGVMAAGVIPLGIAWVGDTVDYEFRQATLARLLLGVLTGMTLGQLAGGLFADSPLGWRGAFGALAAGYLAVGVLLLVRLRTIPAAPPVHTAGVTGFLKQIGAVLAIPWARVVLLSVLVEGMFLLGPLAFLPSYLHRRYDIRVSSAAALISLYAVGGIVYSLMAQHLVRRFGERRMAAAGGVLMGVGFAAWYLSPVAWFAAPVALAVGFGTYLFHNTLQTNATQMSPSARGSAMACFAFCLFFGQAIGVSIAGYAFDHGGPAPLLLLPALVLPVTGAWFAQALKRRPH